MQKQIVRMLLILTIPVGVVRAEKVDPFDKSLPHISWADTADHYGQRCVVYGTVVAAKDIGSRCFLNFHKNYREHFTVVINRKDYANFPTPPDQAYRQKHVRVSGTVIEFGGKPEILLESPDAIEIIDNPTPPESSSATTTTKNETRAETKPKPKPKPSSSSPAVAWQPPADGAIKIATFNVLNLFDNHDDPYVKNEYLPGKKIEEIKLLAKKIHKANADILALQEVENRPFLEEFTASYLSEMGYREVVLIEGNNKRGIDVALLSRLPLGAVVSHRHMDFKDENGNPMRFQRDLLQVRVKPTGLTHFDVFVVHLKSKYGGPQRALPIRLGEARTIRALLDETLQRDPRAAFVICGDFNDTLDSQPLQRIIGTGPAALRVFVDDLDPDNRITFNKEPHLSMIDFILASPAMGAMYQKGSYDVLPGTVGSSGSDHNPVMASFKLVRLPDRD